MSDCAKTHTINKLISLHNLYADRLGEALDLLLKTTDYLPTHLIAEIRTYVTTLKDVVTAENEMDGGV